MMKDTIKLALAKNSANHIMKNLLSVTLICSPIRLAKLQVTVMVILVIITLPSFAEKLAPPLLKKSYSSGQSVNLTTSKSQDKVLKNIQHRVLLGDSDQIQKMALNTTRDEVIKKKNQQKYRSISADLSNNYINDTALETMQSIAKTSDLNNMITSFNQGDFVIFEGYAQLIEDLDDDGYYQTFSVTFDADFITNSVYDEAVVYAELYLSENGGPWIHYYTTDNFVIQGESTDDSFEVYSTLEQGYNTNHYDVLIDLYQDGYANIVASYSSDDSNSLYALPLESSDYDVAYAEVHIDGGSYSLLSLWGLLILLVMRRFKLSLTDY